ncbi:MAG: TonB-dependent receptor [Marinobacter sp.]
MKHSSSVGSRERFTLVAASVAALTLAPAIVLGENTKEEVRELQELVIEASKRGEPAATMNKAVEVANDEELRAKHVETIQELDRAFPSLHMSYSSSELFPIMTLRGTTSAQDFYNPALTVYVDGVPQLPVASFQALGDVDQVELLKGPQGTLYGKNASAGILNIVSRPPGDDPYFHVRTGVSSRDGYQIKGQASGPIQPGLLYGSFSFLSREQKGDLKNPFADDDLGGAQTDAGRVKLRVAPDAVDYTLDLTAARDCTETNQDAFTLFDEIDGRQAAISPDLPEQYRNFEQERCGNQFAVNGSYDIGDWQVSTVVSDQSLDISRRWAIANFFTSQPEQWDQRTVELRMASLSGGNRPWDAVMGVYHQNTDQSRHYLFDMVAPVFSPFIDTRSKNELQSLAAYADLTWYLTGRADISLGGRFSRDHAETSFDGTVAGSGLSGDNEVTENTWIGRVAVGYWLSDRWRTYVNVAQGYKPAGYNLAPSSAADAEGFDRETSISYEVGLRYRSPQVKFATAIYRVNTRDAQMYGDSNRGTQTLTNVGDMNASGMEMSLDWRALPSLSLSASGHYTKAQHDDYSSPASCSDCSGNDVPLVPKYKGSMSVIGHFLPAGHVLEPSVTVSRTGQQYFDSANTLEQPAYTLLDAGVDWRLAPELTLSVYGQNLTDETYRGYGFVFGGTRYAQIADGRTLGVSVDYVY